MSCAIKATEKSMLVNEIISLKVKMTALSFYW
ncbi:hypothetical protein swp_3699 [Shewanella piezotolerans WP3]|uniref:Uncharacterized protein n=1 Tax=Shewanella piezotolerans (strain WP3 / JCM 13877) TaxID=225849 RepID=B8CS95_SHEPW|nr:hypothetical protein swp_3699 [Shewanella piezotolerans WP3]